MGIRISSDGTKRLFDSKSKFEMKFGQWFDSRNLRTDAFILITEFLASKNRPLIIVETGCVRQPGNWLGDGQSTIVWDWMISEHGGSLTSIDLDPKACETAMQLAPNASALCGDSLDLLPKLQTLHAADFLYLDSYDWDGSMNSPIHHRKELGLAWDVIPSGCLIAVDDCLERTRGKGQEVFRVLSRAGIMPILESHVTVWQKPDVAPSWKEIDDAEA